MKPVYWLLDFTLRRSPVSTALFGVWLAILHHVSNSLPAEMPEMIVPQQDKILHFVFFLGGSTVLAASLCQLANLRGFPLFLIVAVIMSILGALDEYNQQFIPGRSGLSPEDWIADMCGALAGVGLLRLILGKLPDKNEARA